MTLRRSCVRTARLIALFVAVLGVASVATAQSPQSKSVFRDARRLDAAADKKPIFGPKGQAFYFISKGDRELSSVFFVLIPPR